MTEAASGLLVIDKPAGLTSFDCVFRLRKALREKRVGHCGTLDPMAEGVLLVLFGSATRDQERYLELEKCYWMRASFGRLTTTGDRDGENLPCEPYQDVSLERVQEIARTFVGEYWQTPPRYAALKYKGRPYYKWAREGVEIPRVPRPVMIYSFEVLSLSGISWEARVRCSRGTYVRVLAEDLAQRLGTGACLEALVRESIGPYRRREALPLSKAQGLSREDLLTYCEEDIHHHARNI